MEIVKKKKKKEKEKPNPKQPFLSVKEPLKKYIFPEYIILDSCLSLTFLSLSYNTASYDLKSS